MEKATTCKSCSDRIEDIVELVMHPCEEIIGVEDLTPSEKSTLLYIEVCCVDYDGELDHEKMNWEDQQNIKVFQAAGWLTVEDFQVTEMNEVGWERAHECRREQSNV